MPALASKLPRVETSLQSRPFSSPPPLVQSTSLTEAPSTLTGHSLSAAFISLQSAVLGPQKTTESLRDASAATAAVQETSTNTEVPGEAEDRDATTFLLCTEALPPEEPTAGTDAGTSPEPSVTPSSDATVPATVSNDRNTKTANKSEPAREPARVVMPSSEIEFVTSTLAPRSKPGSSTTSRRTSPSQSRASPVHLPAYSQAALRDLVCATLAPAAAANLIKSEKREKKEKDTTTTASSPQPGASGIQSGPSGAGSPEPGPSGTQPRDDLAAPDLQLDCLSSDTEESSSEDVQVVKISRRKKTNSSKAPVEVDLTQEMTSDDDEITVEDVRRRADCQQEQQQQSEENKPEIAVANFASVQLGELGMLGEQANIQSSSRGSTPGAGLLSQATQALPSTEQEPPGLYPRVPPDHSYHTRGREAGLLMEVPGVRRLEERGEERRRRGDDRGEERVERRRRGMEEIMEGLEGEEEPRVGEQLDFRPRRLRHPWTDEVMRCSHPPAPGVPGCPAAPGGCPCVRRTQEYGPYGGHTYATPPPAHR